MAIMDNALNVLLIDEPDSHISPRIQNKLLDCLKEISNVQVFVITHNDNFVSELAAEDIIFINSENKNTGHIEALNDINIDVLHSSLGGVITGLTRLQKNLRTFPSQETFPARVYSRRCLRSLRERLHRYRRREAESIRSRN